VLLIDNLTNPALLFFALGITAAVVKSDLEIPKNSSRFISIYLLFSIGFNGGQELAHSHLNSSVVSAFVFGLGSAALVPIYVFYLLKRKWSVQNSGAVAASYGSVSAVTFVTAISYLELNKIEFGGHMVAVMAGMEAPAIIVGVWLMQLYDTDTAKSKTSLKHVAFHSLTNGSVLLILGSLVIGFIASEKQAAGIAPFTTDIFKGFLAVFLLDMGIRCGHGLKNLFKKGLEPFIYGIAFPLVNGSITAYSSGWWIESDGDRFLLSILCASASYIAVPAAMRLVAPKAQEGLYIPMALAITFPFNISLGMPIYLSIIQAC
jgi:hypothetical protein